MDGGKSFMKLPEGHVWLEGDNVLESRDSREYGAVPEALLKGRIIGRVKMGQLRRPLIVVFEVE